MDENKTQNWIDENIAPIVKAGVDRHVAAGDITLPPLPHADVTDPGRFGVAYYPSTMTMYARAAVEADRQTRVNNEPPVTLQPVRFDFAAHLARQRDFSLRTFGPRVRTKGVCDHIRKELIEVEANPNDLTEWIDVIILGLDGALRTSASPGAVVEALVAKQTKNEGRTWPDWRTADLDKAIEHVRTEDGQPTASVEPYAHEYGRSNGDGTYSVVIERGQPRHPVED